MSAGTIVVVAKSPRPGRVKTRLVPSVTPADAALLAEAALRDTLLAVASSAARGVLALDGPIGAWLPPGIEVIPQRGRGLDERIACALDDVGGPAVLIGSDTPQVAPNLLEMGLHALEDADAALGLALDGGWWALGLSHTDPAAVLGVPMSRPTTGRFQMRRLRSLGLRVAPLPVIRDVDRIEDAFAVAIDAPETMFAAELSRIMSRARSGVEAGAGSR